MNEPALDLSTLDLILDTIRDFGARKLPIEKRLALDAKEEFPEAIVRELIGPEIGVHLVFIPEEHGGIGGGAHALYRVCEALARIDLGVATALFAIALGTDPIRVGGTPEQQAKWLRRIAEGPLVVAYGATEPNAGSNLAALAVTRPGTWFFESAGVVTGVPVRNWR